MTGRQIGCYLSTMTPDSPDWHFSNKLHSMLSDKQGNLWLCTHSKGLEKITFFRKPVPYLSPHGAQL